VASCSVICAPCLGRRSVEAAEKYREVKELRLKCLGTTGDLRRGWRSRGMDLQRTEAACAYVDDSIHFLQGPLGFQKRCGMNERAVTFEQRWGQHHIG
jgi:hypothetical protein